MTTIRRTEESEIPLIAECLADKSEDFLSQCGYGNRFFTFPVTTEQISGFQKSRSEDSLFFTILNGDISIGSVELIKHKNEEAGIAATIARFLIYDGYRFKGYGAEALNLIADYAFNNLGLNKLRLGVFDFNVSALKCYKKAGFIEVNRIPIERNPSESSEKWIKIDMELIK